MASSSAVDIAAIANQLQLPRTSVERTIELLDSGNTIPFITRYRRDTTGGLDEQAIERIRDALTAQRQLEDRRQTILRSLAGQGKLTPELETEVQRATSLRRLEDLYLPYKPKKQSLASKAREQGLGPLAEEILADAPECRDLDARARDFVSEDKKVLEPALALIGAGHLLAERFSEDAEVRKQLRKLYRKTAHLVCAKVSDTHKRNPIFKDYFEYRESLSRVRPHRILAINRGEREKVLRVSVEFDRPLLLETAQSALVPAEHTHRDFLLGCVADAIDRLLVPSLEREARREMTEQAELHAVEVFARNLRQLLLQPPLPGRRVLAIDPGYKNGCKLAALDEAGSLLTKGLVHIAACSDEQLATTRTTLAEMIREHRIDLIAIGNGSACRPTEKLIAEMLSSELADLQLAYVIVNEAGASVYSTSAVGREEFPDCDPMQRSAISIGRRLQDPLSELVKIDPASIGVGLYQHDAKAKHLRETLEEVVRSCVSFVGVDPNTASSALLRYVAGLNQLVARRIVEYRAAEGPFRSREDLKKVSGLGEATFVQAAGFLKIDGGENPLDATWVHPENYPAASKLLTTLGVEPQALGQSEAAQRLSAELANRDRQLVAAELSLGLLALDQLVEALERPGRDLRADLPPPLFRRDVVKIEDLSVGMMLRGRVLNVVDFGAFVDVGLSDSGLVHVSAMSRDFVRDPHAVVAVGDEVICWVAAIDPQRRRVSLTMIEPGTEVPHPPKQQRPKRERRRRGGPPQPQPAAGEAAPAGEAASAAGAAAAEQRRRPPQRAGSNTRPPHPPQGERRPRGKRPDRQPQPARTGSFEKRSKLPPKPITQAMAEGKEALRSFSDLLQFSRLKDSQPEEEQPGK